MIYWKFLYISLNSTTDNLHNVCVVSLTFITKRLLIVCWLFTTSISRLPSIFYMICTIIAINDSKYYLIFLRINFE